MLQNAREDAFLDILRPPFFCIPVVYSKQSSERVNLLYYLAIDIGASSGRHIIGWKENNEIHTKEVYRFPNGVIEKDGHLLWDIDALLIEVKKGIEKAKREFSPIYSLSVDTWGVDYVLMENDREIYPVYSYRDERTQNVIPEVHNKIPFDKLYSVTGCQFQCFNTIYQLYDDKINGRLDRATDMLMIPEYLLYKLCGVKAREYTNATTTGIINGLTGQFDEEIISMLGYPQRLFPKLSDPGTVIGEYEGIKCVLCATHDTASAVEGIPMIGNHPYISSGTWSLLGIKLQKSVMDSNSQMSNFSNEGGVGYIRYQKNIMGMWLINFLQKELCPQLSFNEIVELAQKSSCDVLVDANAPDFLSPKSMKDAFDSVTNHSLQSVCDYFCCAYRSLAACYAKSIAELEANTNQKYEKLYIVGGGANNEYLNCLTKEFTGKEIIALPIEATALGNLKIQMEV